MDSLLALGGLFLAAFGAATLLPFQSELVFAAMQLAETAPLGAMIAVASVGNTLGSFVTYLMGRGVDRLKHRKWFPASPEGMARARDWYVRWGVWTLLLSWAPFGDTITLVAGAMRTPVWLFLGLVGLAKTLRYVALAGLTAQVFG